jgi:hypothetical protein
MRGREYVGRFRDYPWATLILAPLMGIFFDPHWEWTRTWTPSAIEVTPRRAVQPGTPGRDRSKPVDLRGQPEGAAPAQGVVVGRDQFVEVTLPHPFAVSGLEIQADGNDAYTITGSSDGERFEEIWLVPPASSRSGLRTRRSPYLFATPSLRALRVAAYLGEEPYSVSAVRVFYPAMVIPLRFAAPTTVWGLLLVLLGLAGIRRTRAFSERCLRGWSRHDVLIATLSTYLVLFRVHAPEALDAVALGGFALGAACVHYFVKNRSVLPVLGAAVLCGVGWWAQRVVNDELRSRVAKTYDLTVDHRSRPDGHDINSDGAYFRGEAKDVQSEDFVILFLGDSFTFGPFLPYEESYPYQVERMLGESSCRQPVRAVNFGWVSSSPLLGLRLLRDIGAKYKPDLLVYTLDMTDFDDDLRYEAALRYQRPAGDLNTVSLGRLLLRATPVRGLERRWQSWLGRARRPTQRDGTLSCEDVLSGARFFVTARPLAQTRPWIEAGVMRNLGAMYDLAHSELGIPMLLVVPPRAYQYSEVECPRNWEASSYEIMGPYALDPFRYFDGVAPRLSYPVLTLLQTFRDAHDFPLFRDDDPHWSAAGTRLVAEAVARELIAREMVPCRNGPGQ